MKPALQAILCCGLAGIPLTVTATEFNRVVNNKSVLGFEFKAVGTTMDGKFTRFNSDIHFDTAKPLNARAKFDIEIESVETDSGEADDQLQGPLWFKSEKYPRASFVSSSLIAVGPNQYAAKGNLTIKGRSLPVTASLTAKPSGGELLLNGHLTIKRLDYAIGEQHWADLSTVANEIKIKFNFVVLASDKAPLANTKKQ